MTPTDPEGLLLVDKPAGWTSHDVVARVRRLMGTRRVGHAGTLDPMATGVLVVGVGRATKLLTFLVGCDKTYAATIRLGQARTTDDAEGELLSRGPAAAIRALDVGAVSAAVASLTGPIQQVPSSVSAIKVGGTRAYARVRGGEQVQLAARPVTVHRFEVLDRHSQLTSQGPVLDLDVIVDVSSGTYVRALARDLGAALGVGGHLTALRRTRVGGFTLEACHPLDGLGERSCSATPERPAGSRASHLLVPVAVAARQALVARELSWDEAGAASHGRALASQTPGRRDPVAAFAPDGTLVAVLDESGARARSRVVFAPGGPADGAG